MLKNRLKSAMSLAVAAGTILNVAFASSAELDKAANSLEAAAREYDQAQVTGNRAQLEQLLADDYVLVNGAGELESKPQLIGEFTSPTFHLQPYVVERATKWVWDDAAVLAGEVRLNGTDGASAFHAHTRFADVWRRRNGKWQVVYTQVTRLKG